MWQNVSLFSIFGRNHRPQTPLSVSSNSARIYLSKLSHLHDHSPWGKEACFVDVFFVWCKIFTLLDKPTKRLRAVEDYAECPHLSPEFSSAFVRGHGSRGKYKVLANLIWQVWLGQPIWLGLCRGGECNREYRVWRAKMKCIYNFWTKSGILLP